MTPKKEHVQNITHRTAGQEYRPTTRVRTIFMAGVFRKNPVLFAGIGLCSSLAVTTKVQYAIAMSVGVLLVTLLSSLIISVTRKFISFRIRMPYYTIIIATLVTCFDQFLKGFYPHISSQMGPYVGLIITNCIIMERAESFASRNKPIMSLIDALGYSIGYGCALLAIAIIREALGFGTVLGYPFFKTGFTQWSVMTLSPGAFIACAVCVWGSNIFLTWWDTRSS